MTPPSVPPSPPASEPPGPPTVPTVPAAPLHGVTVVACEQAVAAPLATRHLADLGARVIKIERPDGGDFARSYDETVQGLSSHFVWLNRGKESLVLDLKAPTSIDLVDRLMATADVFVQNLAPGAADRLGLGAERLRARHPGLVHCSISGYGADGPYRDAKAYDLLIQSEVGLVDITGTDDQAAKTGIPCADISAGMYAFSSILAALYQRNHTGQGAELHVSLFDSLAEWMGYAAYYAHYSGASPRRAGASHAAIAPYGPFATADGEAVVLAVQNEREWARLCRQVLDRPDLVADPELSTTSARVANRDRTDGVVAEALARVTVDEAEALLRAADIAHARQRSATELFSHPQPRAAGRIDKVDTEAGEVLALRPPFGWAEPVTGRSRVPALGEHTDRILAELGDRAEPGAADPRADADGSDAEADAEEF